MLTQQYTKYWKLAEVKLVIQYYFLDVLNDELFSNNQALIQIKNKKFKSNLII